MTPNEAAAREAFALCADFLSFARSGAHFSYPLGTLQRLEALASPRQEAAAGEVPAEHGIAEQLEKALVDRGVERFQVIAFTHRHEILAALKRPPTPRAIPDTAGLSGGDAVGEVRVSGDIDRCIRQALLDSTGFMALCEPATSSIPAPGEAIPATSTGSGGEVGEGAIAVARAYFERGFIASAAWSMTKRGDVQLSDAVIDHAWAHRDEGMDAEDMLPDLSVLTPTWSTDKLRAETAEMALGNHGDRTANGDPAIDPAITQEDVDRATTWWYVNHDRPAPQNLICAFARHRLAALAASSTSGLTDGGVIQADVTFANHVIAGFRTISGRRFAHATADHWLAKDLARHRVENAALAQPDAVTSGMPDRGKG